ncbi:MurR/RpiR family transcriptional regulator [uncultured Tateyamaria sp.]|uniref:MurR/RpiR family transcriptional regulator n=1 Tax=Tateyamaria sp. 1078 TaxID=3417464 RepID=UPI002624C000|nr:MurR/RpiR family transcriptional regulator [uncultured Tateyamaria sp.]
MTETATIEERISRNYAGLSDKLQVAADFVADNPIDIATRSLRSLASTSGVSPATFSRLARALGYHDYEQMREDGRVAMGRKMASFSERAHALRAKATPPDADVFLHRQAAACIANIEYLDRDITNDSLEAAVETLHAAGHVLLVGSQGSSGFVDYFGYLAHWFSPNWSVAGRNGTTLAATMARLGPGDAVLAISKAPYARRTISALQAARDLGVPSIVITDSHTSPALAFASQSFVVPTESPQFFSSYAATLVLIETIITMLLARAGDNAEDMIRDAENQIHALGETWTP